jgi:hypothetical protein
MRLVRLMCGVLAMASIVGGIASGQAASSGPNKVLKTAKVGGEGGFDYVFADVNARRLYIPRRAPAGLTVFDLDTLAPAGAISEIAAGGAVVDEKSHHGFSTSKPVTMWDAQTLKTIKTIDVDGAPDGIMLDTFNDRVWILSHQPPYATIIDAAQGTVVGTLDLGGAPEEAVSDGKGTVYVNISNKSNVAVVDAKALTVTAHYDLSSKNVTGGSGLALDRKNDVLFAYYRQPQPTVVILSAKDGKILTTLPTGTQVDTVTFNPKTMEAISAEGGGTMTFIKENSPTDFNVEQTVTTMPGAKTLAFDSKTGHLLTMTAEWAPLPADAPAPQPGRPARGPMIPGSFTILMVGR